MHNAAVASDKVRARLLFRFLLFGLSVRSRPVFRHAAPSVFILALDMSGACESSSFAAADKVIGWRYGQYWSIGGVCVCNCTVGT